MSTRTAIELNRFCSPRALIRRALCDCLYNLANVRVCCGAFGSWKKDLELSTDFAGVNVTTRNQIRNTNVNTLGGPGGGESEEGDCGSGNCLSVDQMQLLVDIEIVVLGCEAQEFAEVVSAAVGSCFCQHQCKLPLSRLAYTSSDGDFDSKGTEEFFSIVDTYTATYDYNHCSGRMVLNEEKVPQGAVKPTAEQLAEQAAVASIAQWKRSHSKPARVVQQNDPLQIFTPPPKQP